MVVLSEIEEQLKITVGKRVRNQYMQQINHKCWEIFYLKSEAQWMWWMCKNKVSLPVKWSVNFICKMEQEHDTFVNHDVDMVHHPFISG